MGIFNILKNRIKADSLPDLEDPYLLPNSTSDFKEWHYRALRKLRNRPVNVPFSGKISIEVNYDEFTSLVQKLGLVTLTGYKKGLEAKKNEELKQILRTYGFPVSGKKEDLIKRIIENINETDVRNSGYYSDVYMLTAEGENLIANSYAKLESENLNFFKTAVDLILQGQLDDAFRIICKKKAEEPYPTTTGFGLENNNTEYPSLGNNSLWTKWYYEGLNGKTRTIYRKQLKESKDKLVEAATIYSKMYGETLENVKFYLHHAYSVDVEIVDTLRTENNHISTEINFQKYEDTGTEKYCFLAVLDSKTCPECAKLDGKIFPMSEKKVGLNCPPMHKGCRCTTIGVISEELLYTLKRSTRDPRTGQVIKIPMTMTYEDWYSKYVKE